MAGAVLFIPSMIGFVKRLLPLFLVFLRFLEGRKVFCTHRPLKRFLFPLVLVSFEHFTSARAAENRSQPSIDLKEWNLFR